MKKDIMVTHPFMPPKKEFEHYIDQIWERAWLTNQGPLHEQFLKALQEYLHVPHVTLTTNGHLAIEIALKGLEITGEVITSPFTFASTTHALTLNHIRPVFCDINSEDFTIDVNKIEELITEKTTAIMPVHVYGHMCDVEKIDEIAKKYNLKVIYDAAHAFGVMKNGVSIGMFGDVSAFSFHATKLFHTIEGGALIYKNKEYSRVFNAYKNFGIEGEEKIDHVGGNAKMNEFQSAMGLTNLPYVSDIIAERKKITLHYRHRLSNVVGVHYVIPEERGQEHNYAYMPIVLQPKEFGITRNQLYEELKRYGIFTRKYFYPLTSEFGCYKDTYKKVALPVAKNIAENVLCLPIYNGLDIEDVDRICDIIEGVSKGEHND